jgi:hypothetical protein
VAQKTGLIWAGVQNFVWQLETVPKLVGLQERVVQSGISKFIVNSSSDNIRMQFETASLAFIPQPQKRYPIQ